MQIVENRSPAILAAVLAAFLLPGSVFAVSADAGSGTIVIAQLREPANATQDAAAKFVQRMADRAIAELTPKNLSMADRNKRFRALLQDAFDVDEIGRTALGRHWRTASETERNEFLKLFADVTVQDYASRFATYAGESYKINQVRTVSGEAIVTGDILRPDGPPIRVDWRVRPDNGSYRIVDIVLEGVSMVVTQRDEFAAVIQRNGGKVEGLLATLRTKVPGQG